MQRIRLTATEQADLEQLFKTTHDRRLRDLCSAKLLRNGSKIISRFTFTEALPSSAVHKTERDNASPCTNATHTPTSGACAMASGPWDSGAPSPDISCMPCLYADTPCSIWFSRRSLAPGCGRTCPSPWKHRGHSATEMMLKLIIMILLQGPGVKSDPWH